MSNNSPEKTRKAPCFPADGLQFLQRLKRRNTREWFNAHKADYESCVRQPMHELVEALAAEFARFAPETQASPKTSLYRIHRDTRFSKDKKPYKTHVAAVFPPNGLSRHEGASFYFHISPEEVLIGGGLYMPIPEDLRRVREAIALNYPAFQKIASATRLRRMCGEVTGERLQRVPRGFPGDHPAADYLRLKQFLASRTLPAEACTSPDFLSLVVETFKALSPLIAFLNAPILASRKLRGRQHSLLM